MSRYQTAAVVWLVAAGLGAAVTVIFRDDSAWYAITLVASAAAVLVGVGLLWRPNATTILYSTIVGVGWVVTYLILIAIQSDDMQAWTADAFLALVGGVAAFVAYRAGQRSAG